MTFPGLKRRLPATSVAALALLFAAAPAESSAATIFGSRLLNEPANSNPCSGLMGQCTYAAFIHPSAPDGDPYSGGAPVAGVITSFRLRALGTGTVTLRLADVTRAADPGQAFATLAGSGAVVTVAGTGAVESFAARLPVAKGDQLALDVTNVWPIYNNSGNKFTYVYSPPLIAGQGPRASSDVIPELLLQASVEPDADGDGFGDETQDGCPAASARQAPPCTDVTKPVVSGVRLSAKRWRRSVRVRYRLSEAGQVTLRLQRRIGKRYRTLRGTVRRSGTAGVNRLTIKRRFAGRRLKPGRYRLVLRATDAAGNKAAAKRVRFRVLR